jgi:hypothetical protein
MFKNYGHKYWLEWYWFASRNSCSVVDMGIRHHFIKIFSFTLIQLFSKYFPLSSIPFLQYHLFPLIESKMNDIIDKINHIDDEIEADPLHSELRILTWILYQICRNGTKRL